MYEFTGTELALFAESLLVECKAIMLEMMNENQGDADTLDLALTEINDHFGIEE